MCNIYQRLSVTSTKHMHNFPMKFLLKSELCKHEIDFFFLNDDFRHKIVTKKMLKNIEHKFDANPNM